MRFSLTAAWIWLSLVSSVVVAHEGWETESKMVTKTKPPPASATPSSIEVIESISVISSSTRASASASASASSVIPPGQKPPSKPSTPAKKNPKRGLAFAAGRSPDDILNANQTASVISWQYNWANIPPAYLANSNIPFVPMQWGSGAIENFADAVRSQDAKVILAFNEPDYVNESNLDPVQAASLWKTFIEPLKSRGVRLGGPAVTSAGTGRPWLAEFLRACSDCSIDFLPVHWYGMGITGFYDFLWAIHNDYPEYPIWVTEYADISNNDEDVLHFMNETMRYMDEELEWVERYAWFGYFRPEPDVHYNLLRADGGLNALGELYVGADTAHTYYVPTLSDAFQTVRGADEPNQPLVTSWPALAYSGSNRGMAVHAWSGVPLFAISAVLTLGSLLGAF